MIFSEARISHLAHLIFDRLWRDDLVDFSDDTDALRTIKESMAKALAIDEEIDHLVLAKLKRQNKVPGSSEWKILYEKYFREEMRRKNPNP